MANLMLERDDLGCDVDELDARRWSGDWLAVLLEPFDVEFDRVLYQLHDFVACVRCGYAAGQIGDVRPLRRFAR
jgi:hypothetical protein